MSAGARAECALLLVEPVFLLRRTVAGVARELGLAQVHEATSVAAAQRMVEVSPFDALVVSLDDGGAAIELLHKIRLGATRCSSTTPVAVLADACDASTVQRLRLLEVRRVLLKPFRVKGVLESISGLMHARAA